MKADIEALPGVETVAMVNRLPILQPAGNVAIRAPERPPATNRDAPWADRRIVLPDYFQALEIPVLEGRAFDESDDQGNPSVILLSRSTAEALFPDESPLGPRSLRDSRPAGPEGGSGGGFSGRVGGGEKVPIP